MADAEIKAEAKGTGGGSKLVPALLAVNSLLLAAVLAAVLTRPGARHAEAAEGGAPEARHGEKGEKGKDGKEAPGPTVKLPDFIVHLRDADADRYARVSFELELQDEKAKEGVNARLPQIRDGILAYLTDRTADDLRGSEAMAKLKAVLARKLAEIAPGVPVRGLYVTELVVQ